MRGAIRGDWCGASASFDLAALIQRHFRDDGAFDAALAGDSRVFDGTAMEQRRAAEIDRDAGAIVDVGGRQQDDGSFFLTMRPMNIQAEAGHSEDQRQNGRQFGWRVFLRTSAQQPLNGDRADGTVLLLPIAMAGVVMRRRSSRVRARA